MYGYLSTQAMWNFPTEFPNGVMYKIGESDPSQDWNYIHWSVFSHVGNVFRNETVYGINTGRSSSTATPTSSRTARRI
jgi:hypothetical protein